MCIRPLSALPPQHSIEALPQFTFLALPSYVLLELVHTVFYITPATYGQHFFLLQGHKR